MGGLKYNQHSMSVDLRKDFEVCCNNSSKEKLINNLEILEIKR
jgi:hypothetical protein